MRALEKDPGLRYQSADEMRLALEGWLLATGRVVVHGDVARIELGQPELARALEPQTAAAIDTALRALGFGRTPVVVSVLIESLALSLGGRLVPAGHERDDPIGIDE